MGGLEATVDQVVSNVQEPDDAQGAMGGAC